MKYFELGTMCHIEIIDSTVINIEDNIIGVIKGTSKKTLYYSILLYTIIVRKPTTRMMGNKK